MPRLQRPSGPGKPLNERIDAVTEQEEIDEMESERAPDGALSADPVLNARHADRNAHAGMDRSVPGGNSDGAAPGAAPGAPSGPVSRANAKAAARAAAAAAADTAIDADSGRPAAARGATTWVVVADEAVAHIYEKRAAGEDLVDIDTITDAAARADRADLRRDAYGRRGGADLRMGGNATSSAGDDELHREGAQFAARVATWLADALQRERFDALHVVAAPRFLGQLRKALDRHVNDTVVGELAKDLTHAERRELTQRLFPTSTDATATSPPL